MSEKSATNGIDRSAQKYKPSRVADENAVGPQLRQVAEEVRLAGLLDPGRGQVDRRAPAPGRGDGGGVLLDVLVIGVDRRHPQRHGRLDLVRAAAEDRQ